MLPSWSSYKTSSVFCVSLSIPRLVEQKHFKISKELKRRDNMNRVFSILRLGWFIVSFSNSWTFSRTSAVTDRVHIRQWEITDNKADGEVEENPSHDWTVWEPCGLFPSMTLLRHSSTTQLSSLSSSCLLVFLDVVVWCVFVPACLL